MRAWTWDRAGGRKVCVSGLVQEKLQRSLVWTMLWQSVTLFMSSNEAPVHAIYSLPPAGPRRLWDHR